MRKYFMHLALALAVFATYAVAQTSSSQSGNATPNNAQATPGSTSAPAGQSSGQTPGQSGNVPDGVGVPVGQAPSQSTTNPASNDAAAGSNPAAPNSANAAAPNKDASVQKLIQMAYSAEPSLANRVNASVSNNQVVLTGSVSTPAEKKTADQVAQAYASGMQVVDNVNIASAALGANTQTTGGVTGAAAVAQPPQQSVTPQPDATGAVSAGTQGTETGTATQTEAQSGTAGQTGTTPEAQGQAGAASQNQTGTVPQTQGTTSSGTQGTTSATGMSSDQLQAQLQNAFKNEPTLSSCSITSNVSTDNIELTGSCPTDKERETARRMAQSLAGNRRVVDRITLTGNGQGTNANPSQTPPPQF